MKLDQTEVVISGAGGHFPNANTIDILKKALLNNEDLLGKRWDDERGVCDRIGVVDNISHLDTACFGIHRQLAGYMDPMHRLMLERTFEALIDAGVNPIDVKGKRIGVYTSSSVGESDNYIFFEASVGGFGIAGHARSMIPNRISYWLDVKGPSVAYDNSWNGGAHVLQVACDAIKRGQCESAIVGTASLLLNSELSWNYNNMGLLAPDGRTKAFDANANGYARSDGIIILYLQRAQDAKRCYATVLNVEVKFDATRDSRILDIPRLTMTKFLQNFYNNCGVDPAEVGFVEAYGSANKDRDESELSAFEEVYCKNRQTPLLVGSVKTNTGHCEAASFFMSIAKAIIAMETETIPANINYTSPNLNIPALANGKIEVVSKNTKWNSKLAAVNGVGLLSAYSHVLLKANSKVKTEVNDGIPRLVIVSTRTEEGIQEILKQVTVEEKFDPEYVSMVQDLFAKPIAGHLFRGYAILNSQKEEIQQEFEYDPGHKRPIWFVYSGMGSQWTGMASDLMKLPVFAAAIQKCHDVLVPKGVDLLQIVTSDDPHIFNNILHSFVGISAIQIALTDVIQAIGVIPDGIIGHSLGETGCAYADGCITAEQMMLASYSRGKASLESELIEGMMAAIGEGYQTLKDKCPPSIEVACHNGPDSCTISGPTADMEVFVQELKDAGIFAKLVSVGNIAYHSRYVKPAAEPLLKYLKEIIPNALPRSEKWISTSVPEADWGSDLAKTSSAEYHTNNLLSPVLFEEGSKHIPKGAVVIEFAPHGLLQAILRRSLHEDCTNIPLTRKGVDSGLEFLLSAFGKMFLNGLNFELSSIYPPIDYPVSRGTSALSPIVRWEHGDEFRTGHSADSIHYVTASKVIKLALTDERFSYCANHVLGKRRIVPLSTYLEMFYIMMNKVATEPIQNLVFENIIVKRLVTLQDNVSEWVDIMLQKGSGEFEVSLDDEVIITGVVKIPLQSEKFLLDVPKSDVTNGVELSENDIYSEFEHRGHRYRGEFRAIKSLTIGKNGSVGKIRWGNNWALFLEAVIQQHLFRDGEAQQVASSVYSVQRITVSLPALPTAEEDLVVNQHYASDFLWTEGLQVIGITSKPLLVEKTELVYDFIEFSPFTGIEYKDLEKGINLSIQLAIHDFKHPDRISVTELSADNPSLNEIARNVLEKCYRLTCNVSSATDTKMILVPKDEPCLIIYNSYIHEEHVKVITSSHSFFLVRNDENISSYQDVAQVAQFNAGGVTYSLLKKACFITPSFIYVKSDVLTANDMTGSWASWMTELLSAVKKLNTNERIYLVSSVMPLEGIYNFVKNMRALPNMQFVRFMFFLDKDVDESLYHRTIENDIFVSVFQNGTVGAYLPCPIELEGCVDGQHRRDVIQDIDVKYLGINLRDETLTTSEDYKAELGNIDYTGIKKNGERIAGLAWFDYKTMQVKSDPVLSWKLPNSWSYEDAVTIPHAYCTAYTALLEKGKLQIGETVLIHNAASAIGLAATSIASAMTCNIFVTVSTTAQKLLMKKMFNNLLDVNILSTENSNFEILLLKATNGKGAGVVLNTLSGNLLTASLRCVSTMGRFVQLGKFDLERNNTMGMSIFLKNVRVVGVIPENIFKASDEYKQKLHEYVQNAINKYVLRPLRRNIVEHQNIEAMLTDLHKTSNVGKTIIKLSSKMAFNQFNIANTNQFVCSPQGAYVIYGGSADIWIDFAEWLVYRGARNIVIASDSKAQQTYIHRRLTLLEKYYNTNITFSHQRGYNKESAVELLSEIYKTGPIQAVFIVPRQKSDCSRSEIKSISNVECALRTIAPKALFVNLLANVAGVCQERLEEGFRGYNIQWDDKLQFRDILFGLDDMLINTLDNILVKMNTFVEGDKENLQALFRKLTSLLPTNEELRELGSISQVKPDFVQLPTLCPRSTKEIPHVFIIPALYGEVPAKQLALQLFHPTFCAKLSLRSNDITETATKLAQRMREIAKRGPYNIIGMSQSGTLAIEIARIVEAYGDTVQLYLIDGAPDSIQDSLKYLGDGVNYEISLLTRYLDIKSFDAVRQLEACPDWNSRLNFAIENCVIEPSEIEITKTALSELKDCLKSVSNYQPAKTLVSGNVKLIRPSATLKHDFCGLAKYCKEKPDVIVINGDHRSIVNNSATATRINGTVLC